VTEHILEATNLVKSFVIRRNAIGRPRRWAHAVRGVDVRLAPGKTLAVVGESGSGKTTLGRLLLRLIDPDEGEVRLAGTDLMALSARQVRATRKRMQMIFQDPYLSLDPRMIIEDAVGEPLTVHFGIQGAERRQRVLELLDRVGINAAQAERYPHEFSGGQLQRIAIARALAVEPDVIVCDEPVAALDVSIRAQIINLLQDLQRERGVAYVFITHDLSLVRLVADRVAVMYQGRVVEESEPEQLYTNPRHPYTRALLDVIPVPDPARRSRRATRSSVEVARGLEVSDTLHGCSYAARCPSAFSTCWVERPELRRADDGRLVSCHLEADTVPDALTPAATSNAEVPTH
jgi:oligopeptide/dipeptide ABC transporter ATP-binding protein